MNTCTTLKVIAAVLLMTTTTAYAQEAVLQVGVIDEEAVDSSPVSADDGQDVQEAKQPVFNASEYQSVVFTYFEHVAINDARRSRGLVRPPSEAELTRDLGVRVDDLERVKPPPEKREIRLSGMVYKNSGDWTLWLNEQRVTPSAIPEEILDLKVYKNYIEIRWFDEYTNKIFPVRLRPHQRFNIDTQIFLPG